MNNNQTETSKADYLDPMHSLGYLCRVNFRLFSRALEQMTLTHGISAGQWRFLRILWEQDGLSQRELSELVGTREATTVRFVRDLVEAGLVRRQQDALDKRKFIVRCTPRSLKLRDQLMPMVLTVNERAVVDIDPADVETARRVLAQTYRNLSAALEQQET